MSSSNEDKPTGRLADECYQGQSKQGTLLLRLVIFSASWQRLATASVNRKWPLINETDLKCLFWVLSTTTVLRPFFPDHLGEPVPEENFWTLWYKGFYSARNACIASAVLAIAIPSVRLSVCPSLTRRYCVKTTARSTVQFAPLDSRMCLVL